MIYWAPFLHFYQPPIQFHGILKKVCNESYRPLLKMFLEHPAAKVTINMSGVLTEMLNDHGAEDVLEILKELAHRGQLEFVESAKYHPILPLIPAKEMHRQIKLNNQTNKFFFGKLYEPQGFFPPEMCYSNEVAEVVKAMEYEWILLSGVACPDTWPLDFVSAIPCDSSTIKIFYRDDILSNKISFHHLDATGFIKESNGKKDIYVVTAMDAETFGHHIQHWEELFLAEVYETIDTIEDIYKHDDLKQRRDLAMAHKEIFRELKEIPHLEVLCISDLLKKFPANKTHLPRPSSWSSTKEDIAKKDYYPLWKSVSNKLHELQWEHMNICFEIINQALSLKGSNKDSHRFAIFARGLLDRAVHSCQFWWANKERGTWDINLINKGLILQEEAVLNAYKAINVSSATDAIKKDFYHKVAAGRDVANKIRDLLIIPS